MTGLEAPAAGEAALARTTGAISASEAATDVAERTAALVGGGLLLTFCMVRRSQAAAWPLGLAGAALLFRGLAGRWPLATPATAESAEPQVPTRIHVDQAVTVNRRREDLFAFWRQFDNLPRFMRHLESVTVLTGDRTRWVARAPAGRTVEWEAEIIAEKRGSLIAWRTVPGSQIEHSGSVRFTPAPGGRGTEVRVSLEYTPPAGRLGVALARLLGEEPDQQVAEDLRRFKALMEAGEVPTTEGQPSGGRRRD